MATKRLTSRFAALKKSRKGRLLSRRDKESRRMHLERLEERLAMALSPPVLIQADSGSILNNNDTRNVAPKELNFTFVSVPGIDAATLPTGITLTRAGKDGAFGNANDVVIQPAYLDLGSSATEVVMRFATTLPDDLYRVTFVGSVLKDSDGLAFNNGQNYQLDFKLDLGAQVLAVVPQPVSRNASGQLTQALNQIDVYFNDDVLDVASAQNPQFYRLLITKATVDPGDDGDASGQEILPISVTYNATLKKSVLTFASPLHLLAPDDGSADPAKAFRLRIGTSETRRPNAAGTVGGEVTVDWQTADPGSSFGTAVNLGNAITTGAQGTSIAIGQSIGAQPYNLIWPGGDNEPGHRDIDPDNHPGSLIAIVFQPESETFLIGSDGPEDHFGRFIAQDPRVQAAAVADEVDGITTYAYNFRDEIGFIPDGFGGTQPAFNLITENQKQRAREALEMIGRYAGVKFVETEQQGFVIATGDIRAILPTTLVGPAGVTGMAGAVDIDGDGIRETAAAIMDNAEIWNDTFAGNWYTAAMHEINQLLGLGHSYDLPPLTVQGHDPALVGTSPAAEPILPGDHDIAHLQHLYRPDSKDIDIYRFTLDATGVFTAQTFAERLANSSGLDSNLSLYQVTPAGNTLIARNDDYFSKDSQIQLTLGAGTYFVAVSASGNDQFDPTIVDSGIGGTTQGAYQLKLDFRKAATTSIVDATGVSLDGDADGKPGGVNNFWFRAAAPRGTEQSGKARTLFVDRTAAPGGNGSLLQPYNTIPLALANAREFDLVRIVGNNLNPTPDTPDANLSDNRAYHIGFNQVNNQPLRDGSNLLVPKNVTVMIDAGAVFQMRNSLISVGSTAPSAASDRSGGALQVLGTPYQSVFFTSFNEQTSTATPPVPTIGLDENPLDTVPAAGDWGGLAFTNELDRADGRFDWERQGVFLNYVSFADLRFGGGDVVVNSTPQIVNPIDMTDARPTVINNRITLSADAAMSANPDSFEETDFQGGRYASSFSSTFNVDYRRIGPEIHGNLLSNNSTNGMFIRTTTPAGGVLEEMTVPGRFDDTDIVHVIQENLVIAGTPGGATQHTVLTAPPTILVVASPQVGGGNFNAGTQVEYRLVYVDLAGNESLASTTIGLTSPIASNGSSVRLDNLPIPEGDFIARRVYRRVGGPTGTFVLVDQIPATVTTYIDRNAPQPATPLELKVASVDDPVVPPVAIGNTPTVIFTQLSGGGVFPAGANVVYAMTFVDTEGRESPLARVPGSVDIAAVNSSITLSNLPKTPGQYIGLRIYRSVNGGQFDLVGLSDARATSFTDRGEPIPGTIVPPSVQVTFTNVPSIPGVGFFQQGDRVNYRLSYGQVVGGQLLSQGPSVAIPGEFVVGLNNSQIRLDNLPPTNPTLFNSLIVWRSVNGSRFEGLVAIFAGTSFTDAGDLNPLSIFLDDFTPAPAATARARLDGSLVIDPSIIVKSNGSRIEVGMGANLIAEGVAGLRVIYTSLFDDRFGAGGTFDTSNDQALNTPRPGDWAGIYLSPDAKASIDHSLFAYAGGLNRIEGTFTGINPIEIHQADVRIANSRFEFNDLGGLGQAPPDRFGRGPNDDATIFVAGAQPVIINNVAVDNLGAFISVNVNALNSEIQTDSGRQSGRIDRVTGNTGNYGPLVRGNLLDRNQINGMRVRGGVVTTESIWDDTDIVHVLLDTVTIPDFHTKGGVRLKSAARESLVVKSSGVTAGFVATGRPLEIEDRIGGTLQVLGQPGFPVVLTSLSDDTASAGITPDGLPQSDTNGDRSSGLLPTGPEVNNGTLIDNDVATNVVGHFEVRPAAGGSIGTSVPGTTSGVTVQGLTLLQTNQNFIFAFNNFIDVGSNGGAIDLSTTTITTPPTLISDDLVRSEGSFAGANGTINWRVETRLDDGVGIVFNTLTFTSTAALGNLRFINYLDEDVLFPSDDLLLQVGTPGAPDFRLFTLDNQERIGFAQGGVYTAGPDLVNATYDGFAADEFNDLVTAITGAGTNYTVNGNIDTTDLPPFSDPVLGNVHGLADVTTAMAWTVSPTATTATITTFLELVARPPTSGGTAGEWAGLTIGQFANDRNVETVLERENPLSDGSQNAVPEKAQFLGGLAAANKGGDENLRLGFTTLGALSQPGDVDVYSFRATAGTEVWLDLDGTAQSLDSIIELIDNNGVVLARSNNSAAEEGNTESLFGIARPMHKTAPFEGQDFNSVNTLDAGMRVFLPGPANTVNTYFVRVRSNSGLNVTEVTRGMAGLVSELVPGGTLRAIELIRAGSTTVATVLEGASGAISEVVKGGTGLVTELLQGGTGTVTTVVDGVGGAVTETAKGGTQFVMELQKGGSGQVSTEADGGIGTVTEVVKGANSLATEVMRGNSPAVVTIQTGGGGLNEIQSFGFVNPPTGGTFRLTFDGQTTGPLAHNVSAGDVQTALQGLSTIGAGNVAVTFNAGEWRVTFQGALANQNVSQLIGSSNEIQQFSVPFAGMPFTLDFAGQITAPIAGNASDDDVRLALEALSNINPGDVLVSGAGPYTVEFTGNLANSNVATLAVSNREIQRVTLAGSPTAGTTFTLNLTGFPTTAPINVVASAAAVQTALQAVLGAGNVLVTGSPGAWDVHFRGTLGSQDVMPLTVRIDEQQFVNVSNSTTGTFTLEFLGQTTNPISVGAAAITVQNALAALSTIGAGNVLVSGGFGFYFVTFQGAFANMNVAQLTIGANEFQQITNPDAAAGGAVTLSFQGQVTSAIPGNATAAEVQAALEALAVLSPGDVAVTGGAGGPWIVEFTGPTFANIDQPHFKVLATEKMPGGGLPIATALQGNSGSVTEVIKGSNAVATELTRGNSVAIMTTVPGGAGQNEQQTVGFTVPPQAGTFTLRFGLQTTDPIPFFASAGVVQAALENLPALTGNVSVTFAGGVYTVTFQGALANTNVTQLIGRINEFQSFANPIPGNPFTLNVGGQVTPVLPASATSADVQAALEALSTVGAGNVSVSGAAGGPYQVEFIGTLSNVNVTAIAINSREVQRLALAGSPSGGTFQVSFNGVPSAQIPFNASAAQVQTFIGNIAGVGFGNVAVSGNVGGPWDVSFQNALGAQDVPALVPLVNEFQTIDARSSTAGSFTLTFNGQTTASINRAGLSAGILQTQLANIVGAGNVAVTGPVNGLFTVQFQGARANQNVTQLTSSSNEIQRVRPSIPGSGMTLTFNGQTTAAIPFGATALQVQTALENLSNINPGDIQVTAAAGGAYDIQFLGTGSFANTNVPQIVISDSEVQTISLPATPAGTTFTLTFSGQSTQPIPVNATAGQVQAALLMLPALAPNNVAVSGPAGGPWDVAFQNALALTDVGSISAGINEIQTFSIAGTPSGGNFRLSFSGQQTGPIPVGSSAATVQTALEGLGTIGAGNVSVDLSAGVYTVTFIGALGGANRPQLVITVNEAQRIINPIGGSPALTLSFNGVVMPTIPGNADGAGVQAVLQSVLGAGNVLVTGPAGGPWDVEFTGALSNSDQPLFVVHATEVIRGGGPPIATAANGAAGSVVEALAGRDAGSTELMRGGTLSFNTTTQGGGGADEVQTFTFTTPPSGGTFTLTFNGQTTGPLAHNASAAAVQAALQGLSTIGAGNATVAFNGTTWTVTFTGALANTDVDDLTGTADEFQLVPVQTIPFNLNFGGQVTGILAPGASAAQVRTQLEGLSGIGAGNVLVTGGGVNPYTIQFTGAVGNQDVVQLRISDREIQTVSLAGPPTGGTFTLTFGGQTTSALAFNATALQVQAALEALSTIGGGNVTVAAAGPSTWNVSFQGSFTNSDVALLSIANDEVQTIDLRTTTGGFYALSFNGQTTAPLPFGSDAGDVETALSALSTIGPGNVAVTASGGILTITFQGALANQNVAQLTGVANEQQIILKPVNSPSFNLNFNGSITAPIAGNATPAEVQAALVALNNIAPGDVVVSGPAGGPWVVQFGGAYANDDVPQFIVNDSEIQRVTLAGAPTGATFTLSFNMLTTAPIAVDATAAEVQTALEGILGAGNVVVFGNAGGPWDVGFRGVFASLDVAPLVVGADEVQSIQLQNSPTGGGFRLEFGGQTTALIPFNAPAATVEAALEALMIIPPLDVAVTFDPLIGASGTWFVTFQGPLTNTNVPQLIVRTNEFQRITSPVPGGALTLNFNGQTTALIPGNATAAQVQAALEGLSNINPGDILVTGPIGGPYDVEFLSGTPQNEITILDVQVLQANAPSFTTLVQGGPLASERQQLTLLGNPVAGSFTLTFDGQTTALIPFNATALQIQAALEALGNINPGDVFVTKTSATTWELQFSGQYANQNLAQMTGNSNELQRVTPASPGTALRLIFNGQQTATIPAGATAAQVQAALEALGNINPGDVLVTGIAGGPWDVEFRGQYANTDVGAMTVIQDETQRITLTPPPGAGTFTLTFQGQTTAPISVSATAAQVQAALGALSTIGLNNVEVTGPIGGPWDVRFIGPFAQQNVPTLSVSNNEIQRFNLQGVPTGGSFTLNFNGQKTAPIAHNATAQQVQAALEALNNIAPGDITVTALQTGGYEIAFGGAYTNQNVVELTGDVSGVLGGLTDGAYRMQVRLREADEVGGSTIRFAKIANAVNGITVLGGPSHSPLSGERTEINDTANNTQAGAQILGNLLNSDRGAIALAGNLSNTLDVDWFQMTVNYTNIDGANPVPAEITSLNALANVVFDIDYADGAGRPNTAIYVFDQTGRLVLSSRDSNIADDRPAPTAGSGISDLTRGSVGTSDPYIGNIAIPAGTPTGGSVTYFVAIASDAAAPQAMNQFLQAAATNPLTRLEPLTSVHRIVEDHINEGTFAAPINTPRPPPALAPNRGTSALPDVELFVDPSSEVPYHLGDMVLYVVQDDQFTPLNANNQSRLLTIDPFTGIQETVISTFGFEVADLALRDNTRPYGLSRDLDDTIPFQDVQSGHLIELDPATGAATDRGDDGIVTFEEDKTMPRTIPPTTVVANLVNGVRQGYGIQYNAATFADIDNNNADDRLFAVGNRGETFFQIGGGNVNVTTVTQGSGTASEVQDVTLSPTTTAFTLSFNNSPTSLLSFNAPALTVQAALEALPTIGPGNVMVTAIANGWRVTFTGTLANLNVPALVGTTFVTSQFINPEVGSKRNILYQLNPDTGAALVPGPRDLLSGGAWTNAIEVGRILTQPELVLIEPTTVTPPTSTGITFNLRDGDTFDIVDGDTTTTFEFDAGFEMLQTINRAADQVIRDGYFFILDEDTDITDKTGTIFQFDTGSSIVIDLSATAAALVGQVVTVNFGGTTRNFEFVVGMGMPAMGNIAVPLAAGSGAAAIASALANAIGVPGGMMNPLPGTAFVQAGSRRISLIPNPGVTFDSAAVSPGAATQILISGATGAAPILQAVADGVGPMALDGKTFRLSIGGSPATVFEFDTGGGVTAGNIPVTIAAGANSIAVASAMELAIRGQAGFEATRFGDRVVANGLAITFTFVPGQPIVNLLDTPANGGFANTPQFILAEESFDNQQVSTAIINLFNAITGPSAFTVGAEGNPNANGIQGRINFPSPVSPPISPSRLGTGSIDVSGMPVWQQLAASVPGVGDGRVAIPFLAQDDAISQIGSRVTAAINSALTAAFGITSSQDGNNIALNRGSFVVPLGSSLTTAGMGPGGDITGIVDYAVGIPGGVPTTASFLAISSNGGLFDVTVNHRLNSTLPDNNPAKYNQVNNVGTYIQGSAADLVGINFQGLVRGPNSVEGGKYTNIWFALAEQPGGGSRIYAFSYDPVSKVYGGLQPIFVNGETSMPLINPANGMQLLNVRGLAFSNLQENLWNITPYDSPTNQHRQNDAGHGVNTVIDGSRGTDIGHSSYHFGRGVGNNYAFNGGAYGSVVTNEFSLEGYSSFDQPVLYFNYFLNADSSLDIPNPPLGPVYYDTFRVFISGVNDDNRDRNADGIADSNSGDWIMLAHDDNLTTNDPLPGTRMWNQANAGTSAGWRQVRIPLDAFAGMEGLRLRIDFTTAGDMNVGDLNTTGEEIRTVAAEYITDGQFVSVDGVQFELDTGAMFTVPSGGAIPDGELLIVDGVTFEFDRDPVTNVLAGSRPVRVDVTMSAADVMEQLIVAMQSAGIGGVLPRVIDTAVANPLTGVVTIVTTTPHGLRTGDMVFVNDVIGGFNINSAPGAPPFTVTVLDDFRFSYLPPGGGFGSGTGGHWASTLGNAGPFALRDPDTADVDHPDGLIRDNRLNLPGATTVAQIAAPGAAATALTQIGFIGTTSPTPVPIDLLMAREQVANQLEQRLEFAFYDQKLQTNNGSFYDDGDTFTLTGINSGNSATFEFNSGFLMNVPVNGSNQTGPAANRVVDGETITITFGGVTRIFEFDTDNTFVPGPNRVRVGVGGSGTLLPQSQSQVAQTLVAAINGSGLGITSRVVANSRVQLDTQARNVTFSTSNAAKYTLVGNPNVAPGNIPIIFSPSVNFSAASISQAIATAINGPPAPAIPGLTALFNSTAPNRLRFISTDTFQLATTGLTPAGLSFETAVGTTGNVDSFKVAKDLVRLIQHSVDFDPFIGDFLRGPFGHDTFLPGDQFGNYFNRNRGLNNAAEGVYIDDFIIGLAERGEMVSGNPANVNFVANPLVNLNQILLGDYQLEVRRGAGYEFVTPDAPGFTPDTNDRFVQAHTLVAPAGANLRDGQTFTLYDGRSRLTFEFHDNTAVVPPGQFAVAPGNQRINFNASDTDEIIARAMRDAINSLQVQASFRVQASIGDGSTPGTISTTNNRVNLVGAASFLVEGVPAAESNDTLATAIPTGFTGEQFFANGTIGDNPALAIDRATAGRDVDLYSVTLATNQLIRIDIDAQTFNSPLDSVLRLFDANGMELATSDDDQGPGEPANLDSYLEFRAPTAGTYYIGVSGFSNRLYNPVDGTGVISGSTGSYQLEITSALPSAIPSIIFNEEKGDKNLERDQGQIILEGNEVYNSQQFGIRIDNGARTPTDGNAPHQGPVRILAQANTARLVPGVVVVNNVVHNNLQGGIFFSGDGAADAPVPFGRIVNNTLYGGGGTLAPSTPPRNDIGIQVTQNAGPTILNNIIANFATGISVDASSAPNTVSGGNMFQGNTTNSNQPLGAFDEVLANSDPLFVNATGGIFYLKSGSEAIDTSVDSLLDRTSLVTVRNPLGLAQSPILAPDRDGKGQVRVDDPSNAPGAGTGLDPFTDRGAIDRVDNSGPSSTLVNPLDNDAAGLDRDPTLTTVVLDNIFLRDFTISLIDLTDPDGELQGSDINDFTVDGTKVRVFASDGITTVELQQGVDYSFSYDTTSNIIRLTPTGNVWPLSTTYTIVLDPSITDQAGNALVPNHVTPFVAPTAPTTSYLHYYTIFLGSAVDYGDAPDTYGTLGANGASHQIIGNFFLGAGVSADPDGKPSPAADLDNLDDGITFGNLQPGGGPDSSQIVVTASAAGKLDGWFDLNNDGDFLDADEHVLVAEDLIGGGLPQDIRFQIPNGLRTTTFARFRYTSTGIDTPIGPAADGEVEDYQVTLVGPQFQNGANSLDVNNDTIISPIDALLIVNHIAYLTGQLIDPTVPNLPLPITSPPYLPTTPPIDPTGGGIPGQGRFMDTNGDGFLTVLDALLVVNLLNNPPGSPEGAEGEGAGPSAPLLAAAALPAGGASARDESSPAIPGILLAGPSIEFEVRETAAASPAAIASGALQDAQGDQLGLTLLAHDHLARRASRSVQTSVDVLDLDDELPVGPIAESNWDDLLDGLAHDRSRHTRNPRQAH